MRSKTFIAVAAVLLVLLVAAGGVYAYDSSREDRIADGVTIAGVDVGGLSASQARSKVHAEVAGPLRRPVVARYRHHRYTLTPKTSRVTVDVDSSVRAAVERSRDGGIFSRTVRGLTGGDVEAEVDPSVDYDARGVSRLVDRVRSGLDREPVDARVDFAGGTVDRVASHEGMQVRSGTLRRQVTEALVSPTGTRHVRIRVRHVDPDVTTGELAKHYPTVVMVNRGAFQLSLYKHLKLEKSYPVAVGQIGLETPAGRYTIQNKAENPVWNVPNSAWAGSLAGTAVPPGPSNPLKARWMGIYNGAGIHGTDSIGSLGSAASHGCVRMAIPDVIDLYDRVDVGTPVYVL